MARGIFEKAYSLDHHKKPGSLGITAAREMRRSSPTGECYIAGARSLKWKNVDLLKEAFIEGKSADSEIGTTGFELDTGKALYENFVEKMRRAYAVVLVSIGDISPNMILGRHPRRYPIHIDQRERHL